MDIVFDSLTNSPVGDRRVYIIYSIRVLFLLVLTVEYSLRTIILQYAEVVCNVFDISSNSCSLLRSRVMV